MQKKKFDIKKDFIKLKNNKGEFIAKIDLKRGGTLQDLILNGVKVIEQKNYFNYSDSFASSILFPFVNRLKGGIYFFKNKSYQLPINEIGGNAHHGLVFDKRFILDNYELIESDAVINLSYESKGEEGYPFPFKIEIEYMIGFDFMNLNVTITNLSNRDIPYSIGWHPYFVSSDLFKSSVQFNKSHDIVSDDLGVANHRLRSNGLVNINPGNDRLDNCFQLKSNEIKFSTPNYLLSLSCDCDPIFLQIYNPPFKDLFAIELTSGISNSLNNEIGLDVLEQYKSRKISWKLSIIPNE